jgi:hypothetical protein
MSKLLTAKLAVAILTAVVVGGAATAATVANAKSDHGKAKAVGSVDKAPSDRGPDANGPAKDGLCRAWAAGNGRDRGGKAASTAFEALAAAAGGADKVAEFCATGSDDASTRKQAGANSAQGPDRAAQRPEAASAAIPGLCKAAASGKGGQTRQEDAAALKALTEAAGGAANVSSFCAAQPTERREDGAAAGRQRDAQPDDTGHGPDRDQNARATNR